MTVFKIWVDNEDRGNSGSMLSTSGRVLIGLAEDPEIGHLALSLMLGVTETAIEKAVAKLIDAGILTMEKNGRRNRYTIMWDAVARDQDFQVIKEFCDNPTQLNNTRRFGVCENDEKTD